MTEPYGPAAGPPANDPPPGSGAAVPNYGTEARYPAPQPPYPGAPGPRYPSAESPYYYGAPGSGHPPAQPGGYAPPPTPFYGGAAPFPSHARSIWPLVAGLLFVGGCLLGSLTGYIVGQLPGRARATPAPAVSRATATASDRARSSSPPSMPTVLARATAFAQRATRVYGPTSGQLVLTTDTEVANKRTTVQLRDFIVEATFTNPYEPTDYGWDYGFFFRDSGANREYRLYVTSDGEWSLKRVAKAESAPDTPDATDTPTADFTPVDGGTLDNLNTDTGAANRLRLIANGSSGLFFVNDQYVATFDLSAYLEKGAIELGSAFLGDDNKVGASVHYSDFTIWSLQP